MYFLFTLTDRHRDRCTVRWVRALGSQGRGVGPQIRGPISSPAFSIKPQHTGNNLWTWPSNSAAPALSPGSQPLPPPNYIKPALVPLWPSDPPHIPHLDNTNLMSHMQKHMRIIYALIQAQNRHTHTHIQDQVPRVHIEGSVVILQQRLKGE